MAESDSPRLALRRWSADTDTPSRTEFDTAHANLDNLVAIDKQGVFGSRPVAGVRGTYYADTTNGYLWRDDGTAWTTVGAKVLDSVIKSSAVGVVPLAVDGLSGQTANLLNLTVNGASRVTVSAAGAITSVDRLAGAGATLVNTTAGNRVLDVKGASGQSVDLLRLRNFSDTDLFRVTQTGQVISTFLSAQAGAALVGNGSYSNVANMAKFSGTPALEVYAATGGASSTFNDFIYLRHQAADGTAVTRRVGLLMKVGNEASGDAVRTGALYLESSAANFDNPKLVLHRANADVMTFDDTPLATVHVPLTVSGRVTAAAGSDSSFAMGSGRIDMQGSHVALRAGSGAGLYFFSGGSYSNTPGDAGGGTQIGQVTNAGLWNIVRLNITNANDASLSQSSPAFMIGSQSGANLVMDNHEIQVRNNGAAADLSLNDGGGDITLGAASSSVTVPGQFRIGTRRITISDSAPGGPSVGDVWIDT